jgi:IQ and AAA domain-containing protein
VSPLSKDADEALRKWQDKTPAMAAAKGAGKKPGSASKKAKGDDKSKKKKK